MSSLFLFSGVILTSLLGAGAPVVSDAELDLSQAVLVTPEGLSGPRRQAADMLLDEVERRSRIRWTEMHEWPKDAAAVVAIKPQSATGGDWGNVKAAPEGYRLFVENNAVMIDGYDDRGVLFGVGRLLRELRTYRDSVRAPKSLNIATVPKYPLRGHQLGYRPKVNSYDAWTPAMFEQYIRDLAVFGTNAIELIPPRSDDAADSPHFVLPQIEMMARMSKTADDYGIDVWVWYPAIGVNYEKPETVEFALKEWGEVLGKLPRVNAVFVPSGDPGDLEPRDLMDFLAKQADVLHAKHPKAQMWVSTQSFNADGLALFLKLLEERQPAWLNGIVFGPQNRNSLPELRHLIPAQYPIRHYPDITHGLRCQFPVPLWDPAYQLTEHREVINPRPEQFAQIIRDYDDYTIGFLSYSEGCNDDVNKMVWSALGWDPDMPVADALRQYARHFISTEFEELFAEGLLALERNWRGPLLKNESVEPTLARFQEMEKAATPQMLLNWRFQQALYRAYYDACDARRLAYETDLEQQAMDVLKKATKRNARAAIDQAQEILEQAVNAPVAQDLRARVFELAEALFQSIRMQLSVQRYKAISSDRGANLDYIDVPLNNRLWLKNRFDELRKMKNESERLEKIAEIVNWTDPGPGGFYDDLGNMNKQPHLVLDPGFEADPEFREAPIISCANSRGLRMSWIDYAETRFDSPLRMKYDKLDKNAQYKVRVVYTGDNMRAKMGLKANGIEVHPYIPKERPVRPVEFEIPKEATANGVLELAWTQEPGRGGGGRGCQVAEVWLIKK